MKLLTDKAGLYGVGGDNGSELRIVTRADRVESTRDRIAYQMILPNHAAFKHTNEQKLFSETRRQLMAESGLGQVDWESFADLKAGQKDDLRRKYFGLSKAAARIVNRALAEGLTAADPDVLRVIRRYPVRFRAQLYVACCQLGTRATQFCETFPVLALLFFTRQFRGDNLEDTRQMREEGKRMILRGERLRRIAELTGFSMVFRRVKPGAAAQAVVTEASDELMARYLPQSLAAQRRWFAAIDRVSQLGTVFMEWTARWVREMAASKREAVGEINDIADWVRASRPAGILSGRLASHDVSAGCDFVTRPFRKHMSLRTVRRLAGEWHEAVAQGMSESYRVRFPEPLLNAGEIGEFRIVPITDSGALYLEGKSLHHCVATYQDDILSGKCCVYSVQRRSERVATVAVQAADDGLHLGQIRASCNSKPGASCERAIREWFRRSHSCQRSHQQLAANH